MQCGPCLRPDCGECRYCEDKPKFGGPNKLKRACLKRKCIRFIKQQQQGTLSEFAETERAPQLAGNLVQRSAGVSQEKQAVTKHFTTHRFVDVYLCFYCGEEFSARSVLHEHQANCEMKPPELQAITPPSQASQPMYSETRHDASQVSPLPPLLCASSIITPDSSPEDTHTIDYPLTGKDSFISSLGLLPKKHAASHASRKRRNTECENIDIEDDFPISPSLRTPKLLISHLSRDLNGDCSPSSSSPFKNTFCLSPFKRRRSLFSSISEDVTEEEKDESHQNEDDENKDTSESRPAAVGSGKSLYTLDLCSPLGQFVIKHYKGDPSLHILSDLESHCITESANRDESSSRGLRARSTMFPTTFKGYPNKNVLTMHFHLFKFNKLEKKEFMRRVNTGLDFQSRRLKRLMKPCAVALTRIGKKELKLWMASQNDLTVDLTPLTDPEIAYWTNPKLEPAIFPDGLTLSSPNVRNILGLRTSHDKPHADGVRLSVAHFVSEDVCAELHQNRKSVYQSLIYDSYSYEGNSSEEENSPKKAHIVLKSLLARSKQCPLRTLPTNINITDARVKLNFNDNLDALPFSSFKKSLVSSNVSGGRSNKLMKLACGSKSQIRPATKVCGGHTVRLHCTQDEGETIRMSPHLPSPKKPFSSAQTFNKIVCDASRSVADCLDQVQPNYKRISAIRNTLRSPLISEDKSYRMDLTSAITLSESSSPITLPETPSDITLSKSPSALNSKLVLKSSPSADKVTIERAARALKSAMRNVASDLTQRLHKKDNETTPEFQGQCDTAISCIVKDESTVIEDDSEDDVICSRRNKMCTAHKKIKRRQRRSSVVSEDSPITNGSLVAAVRTYMESESSPAIRRLARRGGVEKIRGLDYEEDVSTAISSELQLETAEPSRSRLCDNSDMSIKQPPLVGTIPMVRISSRRSSSPSLFQSSSNRTKAVRSRTNSPNLSVKSDKVPSLIGNIPMVRVSSRRSSSPSVVKSAIKTIDPNLNVRRDNDPPSGKKLQNLSHPFRIVEERRGLRDMSRSQSPRSAPTPSQQQGSRSPRSGGSSLTKYMTVLQRAELRKSLSTSFLDKTQKV